MIRLFKVYYPLRTLVLLAGEALIVRVSFVLGVQTAFWMSEVGFPTPSVLQGRDASLDLKILVVTVVVLFLSHLFDLYDTSSLGAKWDYASRVVLVLAVVTLTLAAVAVRYPGLMPSNNSTIWGLIILTFALFCWRAAYSWMVQQPLFREKVYVLGTGERAKLLVRGLRERSGLGIEVAGWTGNVEGELTRESVAAHLMSLASGTGVRRVIVAFDIARGEEPGSPNLSNGLKMLDRRGTLPVDELLHLRLEGVKVEEATSWLERISGKIEVQQLYPSWLIFADGFRFSAFFRLMRRVLNFSFALAGLVISAPLVPLIILAIKLDSEGPVLYRQKRVGRDAQEFNCYKFRTMCQDAEADTGATWALDDDPRITRVGRFLRSSRLDEIPQLWCVLKGDMHFVGPRPERPEFVEWLSREIPYYRVRHAVRPGITGWAQVQYKYGNTMEDAREKLQYDLFYIKNASLGLDLLIMFHTIKIVLLGRGGP